jgi:ABC-type phosphate/phosphonate transport system substrate-binding protein
MDNGTPATVSRRHALAAMLGAGPWLPCAMAAVDDGAPVRLAVSESLVSDVNLNDARAAMRIWLARISADLNVVIDINPKVFDTTGEILRRARADELDCVALNVVEYRQVADFLDPRQVIAEADATGPEQYILLAKRNSEIQHLGDLRGRRLSMWKAPKMCVASAWLSTILDEGRFPQSERFFGSITLETKASRAVLPVFFGQADACVTSQRSFDTMCELNPQVAKDLTAIVSSPAMIVTFYVFHKNYQGLSRERFAKVYSNLLTSVAGRQLATLFQFENLVVRDAGCLAAALAILRKAERARDTPAAGG